MKKWVILSFGFILLLILPQVGGAAPLADSLQVTTQKWEKQVGNCPMDNTKKQPCLHLEFKYPLFQGHDTALVQALHTYTQNYLLSDLYEEKGRYTNFDQVLRLLTAEREELVKETKGYTIPWDLSRTVQVVSQTSDIISLAAKEYRFLGGAHPTHYTQQATFSRQLKRQLKWADIVIQGKMDALHKVGEVLFRKQRELSETESLAEAGFDFANDRFVLNDNWLMDEQGIRCYYNLYEITAYVMGPTEILIPYTQLKGMIKPEWLVY